MMKNKIIIKQYKIELNKKHKINSLYFIKKLL